jgi:hypothetical protein
VDTEGKVLFMEKDRLSLMEDVVQHAIEDGQRERDQPRHPLQPDVLCDVLPDMCVLCVCFVF